MQYKCTFVQIVYFKILLKVMLIINRILKII